MKGFAPQRQLPVSSSLLRSAPFRLFERRSTVLFCASVAMSTFLRTVTSQNHRALSIQSHTVHGYVGNKAATFPLQCLGINVDAINTISLSNHPGYPGGCKGKSLLPEDVLAIVDGLAANDLLNYDLILTGYTRSLEVASETLSVVNRVLKANSNAIYVLDPVLGDDGRFYVPEELASFFREKLIRLATVITPNQFEAEALTGVKIRSFEDAQRACRTLHAMGPKLCILKGLDLSRPLLPSESDTKPAADPGSLSVLVSLAEPSADNSPPTADTLQHTVLRIDTPRIEGKFSGCGDLFTAISGGLLSKLYRARGSRGCPESGHLWTVAELGQVLDYTAEIMTTVVGKTKNSGARELCIVESIDAYLKAASGLSGYGGALTTEGVASTSTSTSTSTSVAAQSVYYPTHCAPAYIASGPVTGVIFDMDGTLTEPGAIDFGAMYSRTGMQRSEGDIISQINKVEDEKLREELHRIIVEIEMEGCDRMQLRPDLLVFLQAMHKSRIRAAVSTRNCERAFHRFIEATGLHDSRFHPALSRDSLNGLNKPDPRVAEHIIKNCWDTTAGTVWFVGDSDDDMKCGRLAGCKTCLILTDYNAKIANSQYVDLAVNSLSEFGKATGLDL